MFVATLANVDLDSDVGRATVDALVPRLIALADWDCGERIPD